MNVAAVRCANNAGCRAIRLSLSASSSVRQSFPSNFEVVADISNCLVAGWTIALLNYTGEPRRGRHTTGMLLNKLHTNAFFYTFSQICNCNELMVMLVTVFMVKLYADGGKGWVCSPVRYISQAFNKPDLI